MRMHTLQRAHRGFSLLELMTAVAVVGILAVVVVPSFAQDASSKRQDMEVSAVVTELLSREDQFKADNGAYHAAVQCPADTSPDGVPVSDCEDGADWSMLSAQPHLSTLSCTYAISTGCAGDGASPPEGVTFKTGATSWVYVVATCGTGDNMTTYFASSMDTHIQKVKGAAAYTPSSTCSTSAVADDSGTGDSGDSGGTAGAGGTGGTTGGLAGNTGGTTGGTTGSTGGTTGSTGTGSTGSTDSTGTGSTGSTSGSTGTTTTSTGNDNGNGNNYSNNGTGNGNTNGNGNHNGNKNIKY